MPENIYDKSNLKAVLDALPEQIREGYSIETNIRFKGTIERILFCGVGGSSIVGELLSAYLNDLEIKIPLNVVQNYDLPPYADLNSVIIISSYSGNTEEALSCYKEALKKNLNIVTVTSGGKLKEQSEMYHTPMVVLPKGYQPRNAIAYQFFPIIKILENSGILSNRSKDVNELISALKSNISGYGKEAIAIAEKLYGKIPIIYSSMRFFCVAYRMKSELNENSKVLAFCNKFPEMNHNEINGYQNFKLMNIKIHAVILRDEYDNKRILKRMDISKKVIKNITEDQDACTEIRIKGDSFLTKLFTTIYFTDLITYYLAMKYGTDPTPVDIIETFKKEMGPYLR